MEQTLTAELRAELRAKAEAATQGTRMVFNDTDLYQAPSERDLSGVRLAEFTREEDAAFSAAADPPTVLALLDALEEAERQRADWIAAWHTEHDAAVTARADAKGERVQREVVETLLREKCDDCPERSE